MLALLVVAPAQAQGTPTAPLNPQTVIGEVSEAAQTLGTLNVVLLAVVAIMVIVVLIVLAVAYKGLSPLLATIKSLNTSREDLQEQLFKRLEAGDKERATTADINQRTVAQLGEIETRKEAQASRESAVESINTNVTDEHEKTRRLIGDAFEKLTSLETAISLRFDTVDISIKQGFEEIREALQQARQTNEPHPVSVPAPAPETASADGGMLSEVDAKQE